MSETTTPLPKPRPDVVALVAGAYFPANDGGTLPAPDDSPGGGVVHADGRPLTGAEFDVLFSATADEIAAAEKQCIDLVAAESNGQTYVAAALGLAAIRQAAAAKRVVSIVVNGNSATLLADPA